MIKIYGIKNCDKVRASLKWLKSHDHDFDFIDLREQPQTDATIEDWLEHFDLKEILNRRSTTWKNLSDTERTDITKEKALNLLKQHPTLMKRPLLVIDEKPISLGFSEARYSQFFLET